MIVFTVKNKVTNDIFVGSTRNSIEEYWAQLIVKAEENGTGEMLESIREHGADKFEVDTWGYSDSPAETRELVLDASSALNASVIKTGRAINQEAPKETSESPLRQKGSTQDYQDIKDLMVKIELKRKENRKTSSSSTPKTGTPTKASSRKVASNITPNKATRIEKHSKTVTTQSTTAKDKLPEGRVSSSTKEKRIREAIAKEKLEREAQKAAQVAAEADEMAAIMAKLDAKTKEKSKYLRRR